MQLILQDCSPNANISSGEFTGNTYALTCIDGIPYLGNCVQFTGSISNCRIYSTDKIDCKKCHKGFYNLVSSCEGNHDCLIKSLCFKLYRMHR